MDALFHQDLAVVPLGSGSKGNATWVGSERAGVLVDCGISTRQVMARLEAVGLGDAPIDAVLLTHEHTDHVGAVGVLDRALTRARGEPVPFLLTRGTYGQLPDRLRPQRPMFVAPGERVTLGALAVEAHAVPHDVADPVAWVVEGHGARAGVLTDLGHAPRATERLLASLDVAVVEFNHDERMLLDGSYPWPLKQRIRGRHGHLSNRQAADLLRQGATPRLAHVVLAHLSEENNTPERALEAAVDALQGGGLEHTRVHVARQGQAIGPVRVGARPVAPAPRPRGRPQAGRPRAAPPEGTQPTLFEG